jgi:dTMP kinase
LRNLLLDPAKELSPRAEALLYAADRAEHVATVIRPALARGAIVVTDRYVDSSLAYQGAGRALSTAEVQRLSNFATSGLKPDLTVLLDVAVEQGLSRAIDRAAEQHEAPDRLEAEPEDFHQLVRKAFRDLADQDSQRYLVIDAALPRDVIHQLIVRRIDDLLPEKSHGLHTTSPIRLPEGSVSA